MEDLRGSLDSVLGQWGIETAGTASDVEHAARQWLARKGLRAQVLGVRWKTLTLSADHTTAHHLTWHRDNIVSDINKQLGSALLESVRIQTTQGDT